MGGSGTVVFWLTDEVPGGVVKYTVKGQAEDASTVTLIDHGTGAETELDSY